MNLWILHQEANTPDENGPTRHVDIARELAALGCTVTIITSAYSHVAKQARTNQPGSVPGVKFILIPTPAYTRNNWKRLYAMVVFALRARRLRTNTLPKPDLIIGSSPSPFAALAGYDLSRRYRVPFVYEIRDLWPETLIHLAGMKRTHPLVLLLQAIEKTLAKRAQLIIGVLPGIPEYLARYRVNAEKVLYFPNCANFDHPPENLNRDNKPFEVIYTGSHGLANALDTLLDAAKMIKDQGHHDIVYRLIGDGLHKPRLIDKAKRLGLHQIVFNDPVPKSEIHTCLREADACVISWQNSPLYQWGTSANKVFDYMAAAKPIITASNSPYAPAGLACGPVVPAENPEALAQAIIALKTTPLDKRLAMGQSAFQFGKTHHDAKALTKTLFARIKELR